MFYCDECADKCGWPHTMFKSRGRCEMCEQTRTCNERRSADLPIPRRTEPVEPGPITAALRFSKPSDAGNIVAWVDDNGGHCLINIDHNTFMVEGTTVEPGMWVVRRDPGGFSVLTDEGMRDAVSGVPA